MLSIVPIIKALSGRCFLNYERQVDKITAGQLRVGSFSLFTFVLFYLLLFIIASNSCSRLFTFSCPVHEK